MTDPQHKGGWTPGPWTWTVDHRSDRITAIVSKYNGCLVLSAQAGWIDLSPEDENLIVSAPVIADALEKISKLADKDVSSRGLIGVVDLLLEIQQTARAALAKASPDKSGGA